jgi:hypothetical protein
VTLGGPWLTSAVLCQAESPDELAVAEAISVATGTPLRLTLVLFIVRGDHAGSVPLRVECVSPQSEPAGALAVAVDIASTRDTASRVMVPIEIARVSAGVYWFTIATTDRVLTKLPLHVHVRA